MRAVRTAAQAPDAGHVTDLAPAGFVSRLLAMAIDLGVIVTVIVVGTLLAELIGLVLPKWVWLSTAIPAAVGAVVSFVPLIYFFLAVAITGRTAGKAVMGVRVVGLDGRPLPVGRALLRTVAYLVSLIPLFAGFLWVLVDGQRRGWHDHIARSRVVYAPHVTDA
ncbi:MAG TPA: RDD family protein [Candidatus Dormibacteraeota bacterium]|nr:RDD family protein [Candidatus Dormibacteraeota bacterium]